jgi:hypothetical protein
MTKRKAKAVKAWAIVTKRGKFVLALPGKRSCKFYRMPGDQVVPATFTITPSPRKKT